MIPLINKFPSLFVLSSNREANVANYVPVSVPRTETYRESGSEEGEKDVSLFYMWGNVGLYARWELGTIGGYQETKNGFPVQTAGFLVFSPTGPKTWNL